MNSEQRVMPGPVEIRVSGPRASGKTTTAMRIVALLRLMGFEVHYHGFTRREEARIETLLKDGVIIGQLSQRFIVVDESRDFQVAEPTK